MSGFWCPGTPNLGVLHPAPPGSNSRPCPATQECGRASGIRCCRRGETAGLGAAGAPWQTDQPGSGSHLKPWRHSSAPSPIPRRTQQGLFRPERELLHVSHPVPSWILPRFPQRFPVRLPRQEVPGAASVDQYPVLVAVAGHLVRAVRTLVSDSGEWHSPPKATPFELHPCPPPLYKSPRGRTQAREERAGCFGSCQGGQGQEVRVAAAVGLGPGRKLLDD